MNIKIYERFQPNKYKSIFSYYMSSTSNISGSNPNNASVCGLAILFGALFLSGPVEIKQKADIYTGCYEDIEFLFNILTLEEDKSIDFLNDSNFKLFKQLSIPGKDTLPGFGLGNTILHAGYNILDIIRMSVQIDDFLASEIVIPSRYSRIILSRECIKTIFCNNTILRSIVNSAPPHLITTLGLIDKLKINNLKDKLIVKLTTIIDRLTSDNWSRVCEILQKKLDEDEYLKIKMAKLISSKKIDGSVIPQTYEKLFKKKSYYDYYLNDMPKRFEASELDEILGVNIKSKRSRFDYGTIKKNEYREDRVIIKDFLLYLKSIADELDESDEPKELPNDLEEVPKQVPEQPVKPKRFYWFGGKRKTYKNKRRKSTCKKRNISKHSKFSKKN